MHDGSICSMFRLIPTSSQQIMYDAMNILLHRCSRQPSRPTVPSAFHAAALFRDGQPQEQPQEHEIHKSKGKRHCVILKAQTHLSQLQSLQSDNAVYGICKLKVDTRIAHHADGT